MSLDCSICGKTAFSAIESLRRHERGHTAGPKAHVCATCGIGFNRKDVLTKHEKIHNQPNSLSTSAVSNATGSKPFRKRARQACDACSLRRVKCDGDPDAATPSCSNCAADQTDCNYSRKRARTAAIQPVVGPTSSAGTSASSNESLTASTPGDIAVFPSDAPDLSLGQSLFGLPMWPSPTSDTCQPLPFDLNDFLHSTAPLAPALQAADNSWDWHLDEMIAPGQGLSSSTEHPIDFGAVYQPDFQQTVAPQRTSKPIA